MTEGGTHAPMQWAPLKGTIPGVPDGSQLCGTNPYYLVGPGNVEVVGFHMKLAVVRPFRPI